MLYLMGHIELKLYEPDEPEIPTTIAGYVFGSDPIKELNVTLFEIQSVAGKGKGLVARFNIAKGTRILNEKPLFTTPKLSPISLMESRIASKIKALSKIEQRQFLSLHNNFPGKHPFSGIVNTNALPLGPDSVIGGIFPTICRINHCCLPNAQHNWNDDTGCETIHALCYIKPGEEITISYDKGGPSGSRRAHLKDDFGFDCNCSLCSLPTPELQISDARRRKIQLLDETIGDPGRVMDKPNECIADCHSSLLLLEEEYKGSAYAGIARLYYDAFQISITHGDQARASAFAAKGYKSRVICEGEDSPLARKMKGLMADPKGHRNFGTSMRWRTAKALVPKGLDVTGFEEWLWKRGQ
jgi:SET domain